MRPFALLGVLVVSSLSTAAPARVPAADEPPRTISVSGEAEERVAPDEVSLDLGVESFDAELPKAKAANDQRIARILSAVTDAGVAPKDVATDMVSIEPHYDGQSHGGGLASLDGYTVRRGLRVTLRKLSKFDALLTGVLQAGANVVHGINFTTTGLRQHRDHARSLALRAAQEKAAALAKDLGMKLGKARGVSEGGGGFSSSYNPWGGSSRGGGFQNVSQNVSGGGGLEGTLAPGMVGVSASVSVVFDLE